MILIGYEMKLDKELLDMAQQAARTLAEEINEMVRNMGGAPGEWHQWYAWHPVKTIGGNRVWLKQIYRRTQQTIFRRYAGYDYATDFDLLKDLDTPKRATGQRPPKPPPPAPRPHG